MSNCARLAGWWKCTRLAAILEITTTRSPCFDQGHIDGATPEGAQKNLASGRLIKFGTGKVTDYYPILSYILLDFTLYPFVKSSNEFGVSRRTRPADNSGKHTRVPVMGATFSRNSPKTTYSRHRATPTPQADGPSWPIILHSGVVLFTALGCAVCKTRV